MIQLFRVRSSVIPDLFRGERRRRLLVELMRAEREVRAGSRAKHEFDSGRWKGAKAQLLAETGGKCGYCEADTTVVAFGDVEHYRPKSLYWWLAYNYDNYVAACALCNQRFKGDHFPIGGTRLPAPPITETTTDDELEALALAWGPDPLDAAALQSFEESHRSERPLLLHPYLDDPTAFFSYEVDEVVREVTIVPADRSPALRTGRRGVPWAQPARAETGEIRDLSRLLDLPGGGR